MASFKWKLLVSFVATALGPEKKKEKRLLNSHKIASEQGGREKEGRGCAQKTSTASTAHMTLAKFPFVCSSGSTAHSIVLRLVVLFAARGNHNVCIIYLRFAFKGFKLLFNLVFPSWVSRCDDDDENKNNSNKYANFCAFYWKYSEERKWLTSDIEGLAGGVRRRCICCEPLLSVYHIYNEGQVLAIDFASNSQRESIWKCVRILNWCQFKINICLNRWTQF